MTVEVTGYNGQTAVFEDQIMMPPMLKGGDSGSLLLDMNKNAVGLCFAGSDRAGFANRIQNVMEALKIQLAE